LDVNNNTLLEALNCSKNELTLLDMSNATVLEFLNCSSNQLLDIRGLNATANLYGDAQSVKVPMKPDGQNGYESSGIYLFDTDHTLGSVLPASYDPLTQKFTTPTQPEHSLVFFKTDLGQGRILSGFITFNVSQT